MTSAVTCGHPGPLGWLLPVLSPDAWAKSMMAKKLLFEEFPRLLEK